MSIGRPSAKWIWLAGAAALAALTTRSMSRRPQPEPGLGLIGKNDGYTYRYATRHPRQRL
ncbi:hypothetical protein [Mycolicibacterium vulneris]|jgi:hypothetical protein|uniref:hypothetical protein n=1 Tax=Mycolicibacterium vulneris TaxID=547163 RepID=UPI0010560F23|nr:hypothetical protein [Mycolicibacterium vulneris]